MAYTDIDEIVAKLTHNDVAALVYRHIWQQSVSEQFAPGIDQ